MLHRAATTTITTFDWIEFGLVWRLQCYLL